MTLHLFKYQDNIVIQNFDKKRTLLTFHFSLPDFIRFLDDVRQTIKIFEPRAEVGQAITDYFMRIGGSLKGLNLQAAVPAKAVPPRDSNT